MSKRYKSREIILQGLYQNDLVGRSLDNICKFDWVKDRKKIPVDVLLYAKKLINHIVLHLSSIDASIDSYLKQWSVEELFSIDRCILRLSVYSLYYQPDIPYVVVINEAINLAHRFGKDNSYKLVNALLDNICKHIDINFSMTRSIICEEI